MPLPLVPIVAGIAALLGGKFALGRIATDIARDGSATTLRRKIKFGRLREIGGDEAVELYRSLLTPKPAINDRNDLVRYTIILRGYRHQLRNLGASTQMYLNQNHIAHDHIYELQRKAMLELAFVLSTKTEEDPEKQIYHILLSLHIYGMFRHPLSKVEVRKIRENLYNNLLAKLGSPANAILANILSKGEIIDKEELQSTLAKHEVVETNGLNANYITASLADENGDITVEPSLFEMFDFAEQQ